MWLAFVAVWAWYDSTVGSNQAEWWSNWVMLAPILGFLAGYDTYISMREDRSLRLILLQPVARGTVSVSLFIAASLLAIAGLGLFLAYLAVVGRVPGATTALSGTVVVVLGCLPFVAYAQLGSLLLPRDTAVVLGAFLVVLGFGPFDRWLPEAAPGWLHTLVGGVEYIFPTTSRIIGAASGRDSFWTYAMGTLAMAGAALLVIRLVVGRRYLLRRSL